MPNDSKTLTARRILVSGRVQGVGFRPFVSRLAMESNLTGWVRNRTGKVEVHIQGTEPAIATFIRDLRMRAPPLAQPDSVDVSPADPEPLTGFSIASSDSGDSADIHLPPDYFVCTDCLAEMCDPKQRRYRYPFINCTQCGPRYTLIDRLPYDRPNTAMADFPLCPECRAEYENTADRRFHAEPLACPVCGPRLLFRQPGQGDVCGNEEALAACFSALKEGAIVAVKGIGGYHLLCDAGDENVVTRLRERKRRPHKPLALLVPWRGEDGLDTVRNLAELGEEEAASLASPLRPIVLVRKREPFPLAPSIAPGLGEVGIMLPYSPLHELLADGYGTPLVATSANISGEPVLTDQAEVESRLGTVADGFLHHDRSIRRPADDSVFRPIAGRVRPIRVGRGCAPLEMGLPFELEEPLLAVGADLKNTLALAFGKRVVISPHIGDLASVRSREVFERVIGDLTALYGIQPARWVCDAHPQYHSRRWIAERSVDLHSVFHHHAHASALAGEHGITAPMLVFAWDGTGYGEDGTIWGGETLLGQPGAWTRVGSLRPFRLPGGDKASREGWRCALSLCWEAGLDWPKSPREAALLRQVWEKGLNSPLATSAGRVFDAAAALIGVARESTHEGQAAMALEAISTSGGEDIGLPVSKGESGLLRVDWAPLLPRLMDRDRSEAERGALLHASLAGAIVSQALALREEWEIGRVGLTGGVFQNRLLTETARDRLLTQGFEVFLHEQLPSGDGCISFGQVVEAGTWFNSRVE